MKLWKRRPLSEDLSWKDLTIPDEMPPALVYISPGNQKLSKRSSLKYDKTIENRRNLQDLNSFHVPSATGNIDKDCISRNYNLPSFCDCEFKNSVKFNEGTLKSTNLSNKDCKSYLPPVSLEWSPVKDVMKICRSASLPFHSRDLHKPESQEVKVNLNNNLKSPHLSLSEKIKIFFRNRSASRSSRQVLESITEKKKIENAPNSNKIQKRSSRSRTKEIERCKSLYEPGRISEKDINNFNQINNYQSNLVFQKNLSRQKSASKEKKNDKITQSSKKEKMERKCNGIADQYKHAKTQSINPEATQNVLTRGFSASVVSHTASSAAKCKTTSPKTQVNCHNIQKSSRTTDRNCVYKPSEINRSNFTEKVSTVYDSHDICKIDSIISHKPPQAMIAPKFDKKINNVSKSDTPTTRSARFDSIGYKQKSEYLLPNRITPPITNNVESRITTTAVEQRRYFHNVTDDDYVTLAEVNMSLPTNNAFMTQSFYGSVLPTYSNVNLKKDDNEISLRNRCRNSYQHKEIMYQQNKNRSTATNGEVRKRPISCMAVVNAENKTPSPELEYDNKFENINPKSPYLSQYSKLYSLRTNDIETIPRYENEIIDLDLMTRSLHSGHYKTNNTISKDQTGKLSIDSGLVDDINVFHPDSLQQMQNY